MIVYVGTLKEQKRGRQKQSPAYHADTACVYLQRSNPGGFGLISIPAKDAENLYRPCSACVHEGRGK